jgi:rhomboid family protein
MFAIFPYGVDTYRKNFPFLTAAIILINTLAFFHFNFRFDYETIVKTYGFIPDSPSLFTMVTSMFLHANFLHLLFNMWFFWIFANNIEDVTGTLFFLTLYFLGGVSAAFMHSFLASQLDRAIPCIGASGAISAILGAYLVIFPKIKVKMLMYCLWWFKFIKIKAFYYIGVWFLLQYIMACFENLDNVGYGAHIGGFVFGLIAGYLFNEYLRPSAAAAAPAK